MSIWSDSTAIVTGAGSGIGLALSEALIDRGAVVWLTDVNRAATEEAAARLGEHAHAVELDVRDAAAVRDLIGRVATERGRLDFLFNNAGIGVGGEAHELHVEHYDRIIDINIRGVTNGIAAGYPIMQRQRRGHIVNTASAAGLFPTPLLTPYGMTKHAVVGLSKSLRLEAARYGVGVSALCPTAIETPLLDAEMPGDLPTVWRPDIRRFLTAAAGPPYPVASLAADTLKGVERNLELIIVPARARLLARLYRWFPGLVVSQIRKRLAAEIAARSPVS
jgi:NAD(P)-dependent dehydrogenase (short-subunit alcohol dehydrogenase family)